jgi:DNA-binding FadR family transcriptional regulator
VAEDDTPRNSTAALAHLRGMIAAGAAQLPPERALVAELGVGRRAVRRALEVLEAEGAIWRQQGRGTFVGGQPQAAPLRLADLARRTDPTEVMEARLLIEPQLARLAAARATVADVARLRGILARLADSDDSDSRELWDGALHRAIARVAGNPMLLGVFDLIDTVRRDEQWQALRAARRDAPGLARTAGEHAAIVEAIAHGTIAEAEMAMRNHLLAIADRLGAADAPETAHAG